MNDIGNSDWFNSLTDDIMSILTEAEFNSKWVIVDAYHQIGMRIIDDSDKMPVKELVQRVAQNIGRSERTIYQAVQFAKKYESLDTVPEGKSISWHKICNKYLPQSNGKMIEEECLHENFICSKCHKSFNREEIKALDKIK